MVVTLPSRDILIRNKLRSASTQGIDEGDAFFNACYPITSSDFENLSNLYDNYTSILKWCLSVDLIAYNKIHKGTPYYWLGVVAYLMHNYEIAAFFIDSAVAEDFRFQSERGDSHTPAMKFILLEGEKPDQAAQPIVQLAQNRVNELIGDYNRRQQTAATSDLTIELIRKYFLSKAILPENPNLRPLATAFISFCLGWDYLNGLIDLRPGPGTPEPFLMHLFKGCVLFESLLSAKIGDCPSNTLRGKLKCVSGNLGISSDVGKNSFGFNSTSFEDVLKSVSNSDRKIETAIRYTGYCRNTIAHNIGRGINFEKIEYSNMFRMISSACLHALACLYLESQP